jgi:hypothetical protein
MSNLSKRGCLVLGVAIGLAIAGLLWLDANLWYVNGEGYCIGSLVKCFH